MELMLLVYLADIVPVVSDRIVAVSVLTMFVSAMFWLWLQVDGDGSLYDKNYNKEKYDKMMDRIESWRKVIPRIFICALMCFLSAQFIPKDSKTIYLMAGAYMTQQTYESDIGQKIVKIINIKVDDAIRDLEKKEK